MMQTVEARRDKQPVAKPAKRHADIGVTQAFDETHEQEQQRKLQRWNADRQTDHAKPDGRNKIVQQVISVVGPEAHLPLRVVQRVQRVPAAP